MLKEEEAAAHANASGSDDEEMKIPPNFKELVAEVAEELGPFFQIIAEVRVGKIFTKSGGSDKRLKPGL